MASRREEAKRKLKRAKECADSLVNLLVEIAKDCAELDARYTEFRCYELIKDIQRFKELAD